MRESRIAIVGDGAAALITLAVLRQAGLPHGEAVIYGDSPHPLARLERYARSVRQTTMRSEGDGHLDPRNFPSLALVDAWRRRSIGPLLASLFNLYHPSLDRLLDHAAEVARRYDFEGHRVESRINCVRRSQEAGSRFDLYNADWNLIGGARHVVLALGHPGLHWPPAFESLRGHPRVAHAYQAPETGRGERVVVVGGGIAAAHLWLAALDAGADVIALHRLPLRCQALNAPRCDFTAIGIEAYRRLAPEERRNRFQVERGSTYPWRFAWEWRLWRARRAGRFSDRLGTLVRVETGVTPADPLYVWIDDRTALEADRLIFATGFAADVFDHALIRQIAQEHDLPVAAGMLQPDDDFTLPPLSRCDSVCAVVGTLARWALPVSDTFAGMKYAARRLAPLLMQT